MGREEVTFSATILEIMTLSHKINDSSGSHSRLACFLVEKEKKHELFSKILDKDKKNCYFLNYKSI